MATIYRAGMMQGLPEWVEGEDAMRGQNWLWFESLAIQKGTRRSARGERDEAAPFGL